MSKKLLLDVLERVYQIGGKFQQNILEGAFYRKERRGNLRPDHVTLTNLNLTLILF